MDGTSLQFLVMGFGVLIVALSALGVAAPQRLLDWVSRLWSRPWSQWLAIGVRLLLGWALLQIAVHSRCPLALTILGWVAIVAALGLALAGRERVGRLIAWGTGQPAVLLRTWCLVGVAFGLFLLWAVA